MVVGGRWRGEQGIHHAGAVALVLNRASYLLTGSPRCGGGIASTLRPRTPRPGDVPTSPKPMGSAVNVLLVLSGVLLALGPPLIFLPLPHLGTWRDRPVVAPFVDGPSEDRRREKASESRGQGQDQGLGQGQPASAGARAPKTAATAAAAKASGPRDSNQAGAGRPWETSFTNQLPDTVWLLLLPSEPDKSPRRVAVISPGGVEKQLTVKNQRFTAVVPTSSTAAEHPAHEGGAASGSSTDTSKTTIGTTTTETGTPGSPGPGSMSLTWSGPHGGKYLFGHAGDDRTHYNTLIQAQKRCEDLGPARCGGVTTVVLGARTPQKRTAYQVRRESELKDSPTVEVSWVMQVVPVANIGKKTYGPFRVLRDKQVFQIGSTVQEKEVKT